MFGGYGTGQSTKDTAHLRRSKDIKGASGSIVGGMLNKPNKTHLDQQYQQAEVILMLSEKLKGNGFNIHNAGADSDLPRQWVILLPNLQPLPQKK